MKRNKKHISSICLAAALLSLSVPGTVRAEESAGWVSDGMEVHRGRRNRRGPGLEADRRILVLV